MLRIATFLLLLTSGSSAYVIQANYDNEGRVVTFAWPDRATTYRIDTATFPISSSRVEDIVDAAFSAWTSPLTIELSATLSSTSTNVIGYVSSADGMIPQGVGIIALTRLETDGFGNLEQGEILINGAELDFSFSDGSPASGTIDFRDVLTHEIGHFLGLDHAAYLGSRPLRPTMTPFYMVDFPTVRRQLHQDDICGLTALYGGLNVGGSTGEITGKIEDHTGGLFGAHVLVLDASTGSYVASALTGQTSGPTGPGKFEIKGLPEGSYRVRAEPVSGTLDVSTFSGIYRSELARNFASANFPEGDGLPLSVKAGRSIERIDISVSGEADLTAIDIRHPDPDALASPGVMVTFSSSASPWPPLLFHRVDEADAYTSLQMQARGGGAFSAPLPEASSRTEYRLLLFDDTARSSLFPPLTEGPFTYDVTGKTSDILFVTLRDANASVAIDAATGEILSRCSVGDNPSDALVSGSGDRLFITNPGASGSGNEISVIDIASGTVEATLEASTGPLDIVADPSGRTAYVTLSTGRGMAVVNTVTGQLIRTVTVPTGTTGPFGIAVHPTDRRIYLTDPALDRILDLSAETLQFGFFIDTPALPRSIVLSPNGSRLYVGGFEGDLGIIDTQSRELIDTFQTGAPSLSRLVHLANRDLVYATDPIGANLARINLATGETQLITTLPFSFDPRDVVSATHPDTLYVSGGQSNTILVVAAATGIVARTLNVTGAPRGIAVWSRSSGSANQSADFDGDGQVGFSDFLVFASSFGTSFGALDHDDRTDLDGNGVVDFSDFILFAEAFGR